MARYYSNGVYRDDSRNPPVRGEDGFDWWYSPYESPPSQDFTSPVYDSDPRAIIARRELFRSMGGKPTNVSAVQMAEWKREAAQLAYFVGMDPCGAFASKPRVSSYSDPQERWNYPAWAAFANWYWFLDPKYRWELLQDIAAGRCNRWMPVVLEMRKRAPAETLGDPTYQSGDPALVAATGDDPGKVTSDKTPSAKVPAIGSDWTNPCDNSWNSPAWCFGNYRTPQWPVVLPGGQPVTFPGWPTPCSPFPQCVLDMLPPGLPAPCAPWPACAFDVASVIAAATPGAKVLRTSQGATYIPNEAPVPTDVAAAAAKSSAAPYVIAGLIGISGLVLVGMAATR